MASSRFYQPLMQTERGLMVPSPSRTSPLYSSGFNPNQGNTMRLPPPIPPPGGGVAGPQGTQPRPLLQQGMRYGVSTRIPSAPATPVKPKLEVSPYMETVYKSIQNIDPEQREEYLSTTAASIKDRLDRYEFRIARGIPLTAEQQRQYDSIRGAYNDIQKYINNPTPYDEFFAGAYQKVNERAPNRLAIATDIQNIGR